MIPKMNPQVDYLPHSCRSFPSSKLLNQPDGTEANALFALMDSERDDGVGDFPVADTCSIGSVWTVGSSELRLAQHVELGLGWRRKMHNKEDCGKDDWVLDNVLVLQEIVC